MEVKDLETEIMEAEVKKAHQMAEEFTHHMNPKMLREIEAATFSDEEKDLRQRLLPVTAKWLALGYAMGYMNCFEEKRLKSRIII